MNLQYISDSAGKTTGIFIPIKEWDALKTKYKGIETEETDIPVWHKEIVKQRMVAYRNNPKEVMDTDEALDSIEKSW